MTPERWRQIEDLYNLARHRGSEALANADPDVRRKVLAMLAQESGGGILDQPAFELMAGATRTLVTEGSQLGPYRIEALLGQGGMGEVFRARDTRLGRQVAIKTLQVRFTDRFEREARAIAALNHPNICTLHDIGPDYLVMELLERETLAARLKRGRLPIEQAIRYGAQIASALSAAHAKGIVHRDLKPGNVMVTKAGVKVLDFGLAKSTQDEALTAANAVMGTPAYMAPEQREGKACDARTDIYALGLVISEMATGMRPPADERPLFDPSPEQLGHVVERCLAQDPEERWQSARDLKSELEWAARDVRAQRPPGSPVRSGRLWLIPTAVAVLAVVALAMTYFQEPAADKRVISATLLPPDKTSFDFSTMASLSRDGTRTVFSAKSEDGKTRLWLRPLNGTEAQPLPGTSDGTLPFWSPDGRSLGFFAGGKLKKIEISGGLPVDLSDASLGRGGTWATDGTIVFAPDGTSPLFRVPESGGQRLPVTSLNAKRQEATHAFPQFLPDNRHFLFHSLSATVESSGVYLGSLDGGEPKLLLRGISDAVFAPPGYLLFFQNGALMARRFDLSRYELSVDSVTIARLPGTADVASSLSASANGILAYVARASDDGGKLEWFNRDGTSEGTIGEPGIYYTPRLSSDGEKIAVAVAPPGSPTRDLWIFDRAHHNATRLTFDQLHNWTPVWSPDATQLAYSSNPKGKFHIYARPADGSGARQALLEDDAVEYVDSWSSDGKYVAYAREDPGGKPGWDIWVLPLFGNKEPFPVTQSQSNKEDPSISPDRKWLAYDSDESGQWEVYVVRFPHGEGKWQASKGGARQPRWRSDGRELFFVGTGNTLMAAEVLDRGASLDFLLPRSLLQIHSAPSEFRTYDVTGDGKKFIVVNAGAALNPKGITLIANWPALLEKQ